MKKIKPPSEIKQRNTMKKMSDYELSSNLNSEIDKLHAKMSKLERSKIQGKQAFKYSLSYGHIVDYLKDNEIASLRNMSNRHLQTKNYYRFNKQKISQLSRAEQENILLQINKFKNFYGLTATQVKESLKREAETRSKSSGEVYTSKDIMDLRDAMRLWREKLPEAVRKGGSSSILFDSESMQKFIVENNGISKSQIRKLLNNINETFGEDSPNGDTYTQDDFEIWLDNYNFKEGRPEVSFLNSKGESTDITFNPLSGAIYDPVLSKKYTVYDMYNPTTGYSEVYLKDKDGALYSYEEVKNKDGDLFNQLRNRKNK